MFGSAYGSLLWNLVSRSESVQSVTFSAFSVVDDAIAIRFSQTKSDQEGVKHTDNKHCYANPGDPSQCFNTSLGIHFLVNPVNSTEQIFPSTCQTQHFSKVLKQFLGEQTAADKMKDYGLEMSDFGTHSYRKGAETNICTGTTAPPGRDATNIRAGRSNGSVRDRYVGGEEAKEAQACQRGALTRVPVQQDGQHGWLLRQKATEEKAAA